MRNVPFGWPMEMIYTLRNMHIIVLCFVFVSYVINSRWNLVIYEPTSFRVTSLALGQSYDCPSASEVTLEVMDKLGLCLAITKHKKARTIWITCGMFCIPITITSLWTRWRLKSPASRWGIILRSTVRTSDISWFSLPLLLQNGRTETGHIRRGKCWPRFRLILCFQHFSNRWWF